MDGAVNGIFTLERFLVWEQEQEARWEFDGAEAIAMVGESIRHGMLASRISGALQARLDQAEFGVICGNVKVIADRAIRYPDVVVFRSGCDLGADVAPEPVLVVEVVSSRTRRIDRFDKNVDYAATPSIQHYVMLAEERRAAVVCSRTPGGWMAMELEGAGSIALPAIGVDLPFDEIYRRITEGETS